MVQIKFDKSRQYYNNKSNKSYGQGVWFKDTNGDGKYNQGESMIPIGNRIKNSDNSYVQLNSDGSRTLLYANGKLTNTNTSDVDKQAMSKGLVYGRDATLQNNKYVRSNKGRSHWDIDTQRQADKNGAYVDVNNNVAFNDGNNKYIGSIGSNNFIDVYRNKISTDGGNTWSGSTVSKKASVNPFITRRYGTQPLGQYLNPDTNTKTNYAEVNFGDTNGQNQYLKNNYWVYDDGNGNIQTIGFRYKDGKDYAFLNEDNSFLNNNASGTLKAKQSIGSSKLKSYGAGFTPGMEKWRGKGGWYTNVGQELPDFVYGARDGYLYNKQGQQIGFNANGTYYLKDGIPHENSQELTTKNWTLEKELSGRWHDVKNNFTEGWSGFGNDLLNLAGRLYKPGQSLGQRFTGVFGDAGRGIQHLAQGTLGTIMSAQMPQLGKEYVGKAGQLLDLGKDVRAVTSAFGNGKWVTPWDEENHGLADYGDDPVSKQQYQDINDAVNGAAIILSAGELGTAKGAVSGALKGALRGTRTLRAAEAVGKGLGSAAKDLSSIYSKGAYYAGRATKAGLRPSNIAPMADAVKQGFRNARTYYRESAPVVAKPTPVIVETKPIVTGTKQYIQPAVGKLNPSKGAEVVYRMKVNPTQVAQNIVSEPKFVSKENSIVNTSKQLPVRVEQPVIQQPIVKPVIQGVRQTQPKQLALQFAENKPTYIQPTLNQLSAAKKAEIVSRVVPVDYANVAHSIMQPKPTIKLPEFRPSSEFNPISEAKASRVNNTSNVGYIPTRNIKYVETQPTTNGNILQWNQAKEIKAAPKPTKPKSKTKMQKKVNKKYLGGIITKFDNWINANN